MNEGLNEIINEIVPDIPRIYTALAEFVAVLIYILVLKKRIHGVRLVGAIVLSLAVICAVQILAGMLPLFMWIPGMIFAMGIMFLSVFSICKLTPAAAVYWTARAFLLAELAASLEWQLHFYLVETVAIDKNIVMETLFLAVVYAAIFVAAYFLERRYSVSNSSLIISNKDLFSAVVIAMVVFLISNISFISRNTPLSGRYAMEIFYIRTLVNACGLILFYAQQEQRLWLHAKVELNAMENVLQRQYEQYCLSKDNIEILNRRYHDLKHQITAIRLEENPAKREEYLNEMETEIKMYEAQNKTGNRVLDTILTGKSMFCVENKINFTCVAEGALLNFMEVTDICLVVGNALDNAIESVSKIADTEKRLIKMAVYSQNDLLMIRFENYTEASPNFENGIPLTTKLKRENHGYGIKSIKLVAEKYGGSISISANNNWFSLCLLLPIKK